MQCSPPSKTNFTKEQRKQISSQVFRTYFAVLNNLGFFKDRKNKPISSFDTIRKITELFLSTLKIQYKFRQKYSVNFSTIRPTYFLNYYLRNVMPVTHIGGGSEGTIFEMIERSTNNNFALKYYKGSQALKRDVEAVLKFLISHQLVFSLTKIYSTFCLNLPEVEFLDTIKFLVNHLEESSEVINTILSNTNNRIDTRNAEKLKKFYFTSMEVMDGNLDPYPSLIPKELSGDVNEISYLLQLEYTFNTLRFFRVGTTDNIDEGFKYLRNVLYKELSNESFRGEKLIDYQYMHLKLEGNDFYIPMPKYIVKLCDYDGWSIDYSTKNFSEEYLENSYDRLRNYLYPENIKPLTSSILLNESKLKRATELFSLENVPSGATIIDMFPKKEELSVKPRVCCSRLTFK